MMEKRHKYKTGRKRPLAHGDLRLLILKIIKDTPSHGYGLIAHIREATAGLYAPSPGVIYPAIEALQDLELVHIKPEEGKRVLYITQAGLSQLSEQGEALEQIQARLKALANADQALEPDDIRGALSQLRHSTATIFQGKQRGKDNRIKAVQILDKARKDMEKLGQKFG